MKKYVLLIIIFVFSNHFSFSQSDEDAFEDWVLYLADTIKNSYAVDEGRLVDSIFAKQLFLDRIYVKKEGDENIEKFNKIFHQKELKNFKLGKMLAKKVTSEGYYDFVNHYTSVDGDLHLLFRLAGENGGLNYHDYQFIYLDSFYQILDIYMYSSGENFSETLKSLYKNELREYLENKNRLIKKSESTSAVSLMREAKELRNEGKYNEAFDVFERIAPRFQKQKLYLMLKMSISANFENDSIYLSAIQEFENTYPDNPSLYLHAITKFTTIGDYANALKYINKLDIKVGLDPFLDYQRGNVYYLKKDLTNAQKHYEKAYAKFYYFDLYTSMIQVYFETDQEEKFIEMLDALMKDYDYSKEQLSGWVEEEYPKMANAEKFLTWKKTKTP